MSRGSFLNEPSDYSRLLARISLDELSLHPIFNYQTRYMLKMFDIFSHHDISIYFCRASYQQVIVFNHLTLFSEYSLTMAHLPDGVGYWYHFYPLHQLIYHPNIILHPFTTLCTVIEFHKGYLRDSAMTNPYPLD